MCYPIAGVIMEIIIVAIIVIFAYLLLRPKSKVKSKAQKQEEIKQIYKKKLSHALKGIDDADTRIQRKTALLKVFAGELHRNLFFEEHEVRALIKELAEYEPS